MVWIFGGVVLIFLSLGVMAVAAVRAPVCTCEEPDCGGGCTRED